MKSLGSFLIAVAFAGTAVSQVNITQLGHLDYQALRNSDLANIWGYVDEEGNEYALVGVNGNGAPNSGGLSVVDVSDPANPVEVFFAAGPASIWREIKVWGDHAYVTTEANAGLQIVDLSPLPQSHDLPVTLFQGNGWTTAHSLFIDENGRLYLHGANRGNGGVIMYDLTQDPEVPVEVGTVDVLYCHDSYARGDTLYAAHIYNGLLSITNVNNPAAPQLLGSVTTPSAFTHNVWLDDSGQYAFTTDEVGNAYVAAYDISDLSDIKEVDRLQSDAGHNVIPHNTYWLDHFLVTSYYTYGVVIYDATRPWNLVETGHYDTSPFNSGGFHGAWGVYAFLPSGNLLISDIENGLFILSPTYVHAAWLEGLVTDLGTGLPINQASVTLGTPDATDGTGFDGKYALGTVNGGTYTVTASAPGYPDRVYTGVQLVNGEPTILDIQLGLGAGVAANSVAAEVSLSVSPNPVSGMFTIGNMGGAGVLRVLDLQGRTVLGPVNVEQALPLDARGLPAGSYMVHMVREDGALRTARFVKQ